MWASVLKAFDVKVTRVESSTQKAGAPLPAGLGVVGVRIRMSTRPSKYSNGGCRGSPLESVFFLESLRVIPVLFSETHCEVVGNFSKRFLLWNP